MTFTWFHLLEILYWLAQRRFHYGDIGSTAPSCIDRAVILTEYGNASAAQHAQPSAIPAVSRPPVSLPPLITNP